jgi:hypothetical protein
LLERLEKSDLVGSKTLTNNGTLIFEEGGEVASLNAAISWLQAIGGSVVVQLKEVFYSANAITILR